MVTWVLFETISHILCVMFAVLNMLLLIPNFMVKSPSFKVFSPNIKIFTRFILFTFAIIPFGSLIISIFILTTSSCRFPICNIIYWSTSYSTTLVRVTIPVYMIDGLIATIFYSHYYKFTSKTFGYIYIAFTYSAAGLWTFILYYSNNYYYNHKLIFAASVEITTIVLWNLLYCRNKNLHKLLRYQANLKIRSQIITNIKTLKLCLLYNFLFSIFPFFVAVISLLIFVFLKKAVPPTFALLGYNICITICMIIRARRHWHTRRTIKVYAKEISEERVKIVFNSLGKAIPASHTMDSHFVALKSQWA